MSYFDELALAYAGRFAALESARSRLMDQRERFLEEVRGLVGGVATTAQGIRLVGTPVLQKDNHWAHWHLRWSADEDGRILYVSCWFPGRFGGDATLVGVATIVCEGKDAALEPLSGALLEDLRGLPNGPGDAPRVDHDPTGVQRQTLRISQFPISEATPDKLAEEVVAHLGFAQRAVDAIESQLNVPWAVRRISNALEPHLLSPQVGWSEYTGSDDEDFWIGLQGDEGGTGYIYLTAGISGIWWVVKDDDDASAGIKAARSRKVREAIHSWTPDGQGARKQLLFNLNQVRDARKSGAVEAVEVRLRETFDRLLRAVL